MRGVGLKVGLHQTLLDKHDAELDAQRQLLEDLKSKVSLLRKNSLDSGKMSCETSSETASTAGSSTQSEWCPHNVLVRGWAPFSSRPSSKIDCTEYKKLSEDLLSILPTCPKNNVVIRAPCAANYQISLGIKEGGWDARQSQCRLNVEPSNDNDNDNDTLREVPHQSNEGLALQARVSGP